LFIGLFVSLVLCYFHWLLSVPRCSGYYHNINTNEEPIIDRYSHRLSKINFVYQWAIMGLLLFILLFILFIISRVFVVQRGVFLDFALDLTVDSCRVSSWPCNVICISMSAASQSVSRQQPNIKNIHLNTFSFDMSKWKDRYIWSHTMSFDIRIVKQAGFPSIELTAYGSDYITMIPLLRYLRNFAYFI
jgi:hypothetical protein